MSLDISLIMAVDTGGNEPFVVELFETNITHNLNKMAQAAGLYDYLWRPEEMGIERAGELIELLEKGLDNVETHPDYFKKFDAVNGWGTYEDFIPWLREYLEAVKKHPKAIISVQR